jgi:hypothetical protein
VGVVSGPAGARNGERGRLALLVALSVFWGDALVRTVVPTEDWKRLSLCAAATVLVWVLSAPKRSRRGSV